MADDKNPNCRDGIPGCYCKVGWPYEKMCPDCRDGRRPEDNDSYCVCPPKEIQEVAIGVDHAKGKAFDASIVHINGEPVGKLTSFTIKSDFPERSPTQIFELSPMQEEYFIPGKTEMEIKMRKVQYFAKAMRRALKSVCRDPSRGLMGCLRLGKWEEGMSQEEHLRSYYRANWSIFLRKDLFGRRKRIRHKRVKRFLRKMLLPLTVAAEIRRTMERPSYARMLLPPRPVEEK